jgi:putative transposase
MKSVFHHRNIRLPPGTYRGTNAYFITICTADRRKVLTNPAVCNRLLDLLREESVIRSFSAYCMMPDHLHFLAQGLDGTSDLLALVKSFRIKSSRGHSRLTGNVLWQKKFYDHVLRSTISLDSVAWYIWLNPVRAGLSKNAGEFPFAGSFTIAEPFRRSPKTIWKPEWKNSL